MFMGFFRLSILPFEIGERNVQRFGCYEIYKLFVLAHLR